MNILTTEFFSDSVTSMNGTFGAVSYKLNKFKLKSDISSLPRSCFENCSSLTDVDISECGSLTTLNNYCFSGCTGLKSIIIPKSVNLIMPYCFRYCSSLTEIEIPDGVQELSTYSFYECSNLNTIILPDSIKLISSYALGLASYSSKEFIIKFKGTQEQWNSISKGSNWSYKRNNVAMIYDFSNDNEIVTEV